MYFIIFVFLFNCENRKKKGILPAAKLEDLMILYFFTGGVSIMNNCDTRFNYTVGKVNEPVSGNGVTFISRYYTLREGNYLYIKNTNSSSSCTVQASFTFCDFLNNQTIDWKNTQQVCRNLKENNIRVSAADVEKKCYLNGDLLSQFSNSVIILIGGYNESSTSSEKCSFYGEMK